MRTALSQFLVNREDRYKPNDPELDGLNRLEKIDFTGEIHLSDKPTKTDMIIVQPGDLVISGINVAKGAISVYEGKEPVTATIHYSSYAFDKEKIDISYFRRYLKSPAFVQELLNQVKGGIKTEIKPHHLLPIVIELPDKDKQAEIVTHFESFEDELVELDTETTKQKDQLSGLRQTILQEAIQGKLTAEWRKKNPVRKGDPDYDASALLDKIKAEKQKLIAEGKIKKEKPLPPIKPEEIPFALPEGWVWVRLGEVAAGFQYGSSARSVKSGDVPVLRMGNIQNGKIAWENLAFTKDKEEIEKYCLCHGDLLFNRTNSRELVGKTALYDSERPAIYAGYLVRFYPLGGIIANLINFIMNSKLHREWCDENKSDALGQSNINATKLRTFLIPLPPLAEQKAIVERVNNLLSMVDELETQVSERKVLAEQLMQSVLREAFEG